MMQEDVQIRFLRIEDIKLLGHLHFPWTTKEKTIEKWQRYLAEQDTQKRVVCIVEREGKILGYGSLLKYSDYIPFRSNNIPEIQDVWIFEEERNKGFGSLLIMNLEQLAKKQGYQKIGIGVGLYKDYGSAQKLYFQMGYRPNGEGISYQYAPVIAGEKYPVDDDLVLWLQKLI